MNGSHAVINAAFLCCSADCLLAGTLLADHYMYFSVMASDAVMRLIAPKYFFQSNMPAIFFSCEVSVIFNIVSFSRVSVRSKTQAYRSKKGVSQYSNKL